MPQRRIILASSSPYRREILARLGLGFTCESPNIDETPQLGETAAQLVARLAREKAQAVAASHPDALVIGADQVAECAGEIFGKPGNFANAQAQLRRMSGRSVSLRCGLAVVDADSGEYRVAGDTFEVEFRRLDAARIARYLRRTEPYDCCGGLKAEGVGIALLKRLRGDDPNTLLGLPLIRLCELLSEFGVEVI